MSSQKFYIVHRKGKSKVAYFSFFLQLVFYFLLYVFQKKIKPNFYSGYEGEVSFDPPNTISVILFCSLSWKKLSKRPFSHCFTNQLGFIVSWLALFGMNGIYFCVVELKYQLVSIVKVLPFYFCQSFVIHLGKKKLIHVCYLEENVHE